MPPAAPGSAGRSDHSCLTLVLLAGLAGLGWLSAALLAGHALRDLIPYCC